MDYDLSPPWTLLNMAMALNLGLLIIPQEERTIERGKAFLMVNNRTTNQRQSWIPEAPAGEQALFIPATSNDNHPVLAIVEEHKLYFDLHINFPYVYMGPRQVYDLGCMSSRSTKCA